jgi:phosphonate transport system permease protein
MTTYEDAQQRFGAREPNTWRLASPLNPRLFAILVIVGIFLTWSGRKNELYKLPVMVTQGVGESIGLTKQSEIGPAIRRLISGFLPPRFDSREDISSIPHFDPKHLPFGAYLRTEPIKEYSAVESQWKIIDTRTFLIDPIGYLKRDIFLMLETIEIAIWGTLLALTLAFIPAWFGAKNLTSNRFAYSAARTFCSMSRALPPQISTLIYVAIFGFGVIPGIVALGVATVGFLGKFLADDIENCDRGPQEALQCQGANKFKVFRYAILPQVLPSYLAYIQYILESNVRNAAALGAMGAGGIGMEIAGRFSMFDYGHASATLLVLFFTVLALERLTQFVRGKIII